MPEVLTMVTIDPKLGLAVYQLTSGHNSGRFISFIEKSIDYLIHEGISHFVINLAGISLITSRELSVLLKISGCLPQSAVVLAGVSEKTLILFKITGLIKIFKIYEEVPKAIKAFLKSGEDIETDLHPKCMKAKNEWDIHRKSSAV